MTKPCKLCGNPIPILSKADYCSSCKRIRAHKRKKPAQNKCECGTIISQRKTWCNECAETRRVEFQKIWKKEHKDRRAIERPILGQKTVRILAETDATREALDIEILKAKKLLAGEDLYFRDKKYSIEKRMDI